MIKGKVKFYGVKAKERYNSKSKTWVKTGEKEVVLTIENPLFTDSAIEKIQKFYEDCDNKPKWYDGLITKDEKPDILTFKTYIEYEPKTINIIDDSGRTIEKPISEVGMIDAEIVMTYNGCYIGKMMLLKEGKKYNAFSNVDFDELPFK